ncbi:MAG: hypothetical protein EZS28_046184 [Streblomastix strix]|uniref:Autophagy-related protein 2/VPS13 C-terminal domain-containing protein n=1 Tax=Streblomastix strix TaxID=222440 RepID=A0A5J4TJR3_9EUKA|nr:MAG: hypothetical protein EZS28_046184 [Streblomastix strix]
MLLILYLLLVRLQLSQFHQILAGIVIVQLTQQVQTQQQVALPLAPSGARVYLVPPEVKVFLGQSKNSCLDKAKDQAAKWVAPVLHKVMGAVSGPLGAINPTAGMIARGVGGAAGMANKFLNR